MFRVCYIENDELKIRGGFNQISEAIKFAKSEYIVALNIAVWNDYTDSFMKIIEF